MISFLLNYGFAYDNGVDCPSVPTNAVIIKASFLFDCINAFQGIIMFCVLFFDADMVRRIRKCFSTKVKKPTSFHLASSSCSKADNVTKEHEHDGEVKFDHHEQQITIRANRTWRTPSPQPSAGMPPITTQVEVTEEYCSRNGKAMEDTNDTSRGLEVTRFALTRQSRNSFEGCTDCTSKQDKRTGEELKTKNVDFSMQFP